MLRPTFTGHRRYSITHRAVQRLRELVPTIEPADDEGVRDRLDQALADAEDGNRVIRTLDAMLGEPQMLIPIDTFGVLLYAIIKEDTVVTVLPQSHGEEIIARGQAMEQRVHTGIARPRIDRVEPDRFEPRRKWRTESSPLVVERIVRGTGALQAPLAAPPSRLEGFPAIEPLPRHSPLSPTPAAPSEPVAPFRPAAATVRPSEPTTRAPLSPVAKQLKRALDLAQRRAAVSALGEWLALQHREASLLPVWNELASEGIPERMTVGDLVRAARAVSP